MVKLETVHTGRFRGLCMDAPFGAGATLDMVHLDRREVGGEPESFACCLWCRVASTSLPPILGRASVMDVRQVRRSWPSPTSSPRQDHRNFLASICHAITDPPVTKIRLWPSFGVQIRTRWRARNFFHAFPPKKTVKSSSDGRARHRNRSGVVELVGREPLIFARVENGVTIFLPKRQKTPKCWIRNSNFQWGIFIFGRGKI